MDYSTLKNFLGGFYYQTVWMDYASDEEIWDAYIKNAAKEEVVDLLKDIDLVLVEKEEKIKEFLLSAESGGLSLGELSAVEWLQNLKNYLKKVL